MKKYLKRILIILLILIVIVGYYANKNYKLYIRNKDNIFTSKFNMRPYMIKQAEKLMHKDGQQAKVESILSPCYRLCMTERSVMDGVNSK